VREANLAHIAVGAEGALVLGEEGGEAEGALGGGSAAVDRGKGPSAHFEWVVFVVVQGVLVLWVLVADCLQFPCLFDGSI